MGWAVSFHVIKPVIETQQLCVVQFFWPGLERDSKFIASTALSTLKCIQSCGDPAQI